MELAAARQLVTKNNLKALTKRSDIIAAFGLASILLVMIIPLPSLLLDFFLALNISVSLLILIISIYTVKTAEFSIFPALLLTTTLFRLALNVASTRLILLHGDQGHDAAGHIIQAFGQFVVGGSYVVGVVIFSILVLINFIVITKGAGRVAEVAARFTLDAMPGKQMAIDADLNAGLIDEKTARRRRQEIADESAFHGAMDGASKFVRGDAIAAIIITLVNIGAGFVIGVVQKGMPIGDAAANYTILTVGEGLVSQIPALIISTSAAMLVTRAAGEKDFGTDLQKQFSQSSVALFVVSVMVLLFSLIPGMPFIPFALLSIGVGLMALHIYQRQEKAMAAVPEMAIPAEAPVVPEENYEQMLTVDLLQLEVGYGLIPYVDINQDGELLRRIQGIRRQFAQSMGFIVPPVHIKDNLQLSPNEYAFSLKGVRIAGSEIMPGHYMAMDSGMATDKIKGITTTEPAFGLPAIWITEDKKEAALMAGYTVVDAATVIATHINEVIKQHASELIGRQEAQLLIENLGKNYPKLVEDLVPNILALGTIMRVLQRLLKEGIPIRDLRTILETMADWAPMTRDPDILTEYVRHALSRTISSMLAINGLIPLLTLAKPVEDAIAAAVQHKETGSYLSIDPKIAQSILDSIGQGLPLFEGAQKPVLLAPPQIRPHVRGLIERYFPNLFVLSHNEIAPNLKISSLATVTL